MIYRLSLPLELAIKVGALATQRAMSDAALIVECIKVGLIAAKVHSEGGRVLLERDGETTVLEWEG